jgi:hypothetical protein
VKKLRRDVGAAFMRPKQYSNGLRSGEHVFAMGEDTIKGLRNLPKIYLLLDVSQASTLRGNKEVKRLKLKVEGRREGRVC